MSLPNKYSANHTTIIAGCLSAIAYLYLAINSQHYGDASLYQLLSVSGVCALLGGVAWLHHWRAQTQISLWHLLGFALLFRIIALFAFPILEDDMYRFLWDGFQTVRTGSPYDIAPAEFFEVQGLGDRFETVLGAINYPEVATVYGPVCQWIFALAYIISPGEIWPLQLIFGLADLALIAVLLKLAKPSSVLLYAWSPLIIKEFAFTAHPDVFGALLLMLAVVAYKRGNAFWVGVLMACAAGIKVFAIMLLPFLLGFKWRGWLAFAITAVAVSLPFGVLSAWLPEGLKVMGSNWFFNAPLYTAFANWGPQGVSIVWFKLILLSSLALGAGLYLLQVLRQYAGGHWPPTNIVRGDLLFAALLLCLPALNPWYLVWMLPFAVIRPSLWAWVAASSVLLSYATGINLENTSLQPYQHPNWVLVVEFGLIALAANFDILRNRKNVERTP